MSGVPRSTDAPTPSPTRLLGATGAPGERLCLVVIGERTVATHFLPAVGDLVIGRSLKSDIHIDDASISRRHARLQVGPPVTLEDLGGVNGTRVGERVLEPHQPVLFAVGDAAQLGTVIVLLQHRAAPVRLRRVWPHEYFEWLIDKECARAAQGGQAFAVLRLRTSGSVRVEAVEDALLEAARSVDVVGGYGPREHELLLVGVSAEEAEGLAQHIAGVVAACGASARWGLAVYPRDGRSPDELLSAAGGQRADAASAAASPPLASPDSAMRHVYALVDRIARSTLSVLLLGETGVGKEVTAERIHRSSPRAGQPFLRLNCAALSESLLESELFGHERGAFTGAMQTKPGLLETAQGGTVFLDEVGELSAAIQSKLLRVLEDRQVLRVGGLKPRAIDVRFIAATNRDLEAEVQRGGFRQDLYFRLNGVTVVIPPLRERRGEIEPLARRFVDQAARDLELPGGVALSSEALVMLRRYPWPGNIRELRNVIERAVVLSDDGVIRPEHLPGDTMRAAVAVEAAAEPPAIGAPPAPAAAAGASIDRAEFRRQIADAERSRILAALERCAGNQTEAALLLGVSRRTLTNRLNALGIERPRKGRPARRGKSSR